MGCGDDSGSNLSSINWGEIREPYIGEVTQKLAGTLGGQLGKPATPTGNLPYIAPMNQLQQNAPDLINRMMGYGKFQPPGLQTSMGAGGAPPGGPIPGPTNPYNPGQPGGPNHPGMPPGPYPIVPNLPPGPDQEVYPMGQPGVQPMPNFPMARPMPYPMNQPMPYPGFDPLRRR